MYKLVAIDLDGTLLNSEGEVSKKNRDAINLAKEKGIEVVLCSGRITNSVKNIALDIGADKYLISGNGTEIYDIANEKVLYSNCINKTTVLDLVKYCEENSIYYSLHAENSIIAKSLNHNILVYNSENAKKEVSKRTNINITQNIYEYIENSPAERFGKLTISDGNKSIFNGIISGLQKYKDLEILDVAHMSNKTIQVGTEQIDLQYYYTEVTAKNVNKWNALKELANMLNLKEEEIVCIGDNVNDKEMIQNAGLRNSDGQQCVLYKRNC